MTSIAAPPGTDFIFVHLDRLVESPWNPRKHFHQGKLEELAASIREHGVITPLLARPASSKDGEDTYELAAGHRRFRASRLAGQDVVPVLVRDLTDIQFLEVLTIENLQRDDVHPLEEAQGYQELITRGGYDAQRIADRVGKSIKYIYDRIKLLQLIPEAKKLFLSDRITAGHAILLARLKKEDQARVVDPKNVDYNGSNRAALWEHEMQQFHPLLDAEHRKARKEDPYLELKTKSVRELEAWIDDHIRLDLKRDRDPLLFPEIAEVVATAQEMNLKVVPVTYDHVLKDDARADEKTYGNKSWKRADGKHGSKTCDHSVTGWVAAGPGRGEAFPVCIAKEKCKVHWKENVKRVEDRKQAKRTIETEGSASPASEKARRRAEEEAARQAEQDALHQLEQERYSDAIGGIQKRLAEHLKKAAAGGASKLADYLVKEIEDQFYGVSSKGAAKLHARGKSADDFVRHLVVMLIMQRFDDLDREEMGEQLAELGFDLEKQLDEISPKPEKEKPAKPAKKRS
jgi:ParB/RepB/Spo0J family partition protein